MRKEGSQQLIRICVVSLISALLPSMGGCAVGGRDSSRQMKASGQQSSVPAMRTTMTPAPLKVEKPLSTAIEEFLARTQAYSAQDETIVQANSVTLPVSKMGKAHVSSNRKEVGEKPVFRSTILTPTTRYRGDATLARNTLSSSVVGRRPAAIPAIQRVFVRGKSLTQAMPVVQVVNEISNQPLNAGHQEILTSDRILSHFRDQVQDETSLADVWTLKFVELALGRPTDDANTMASLALETQQMLGVLLRAVEEVHRSLLSPTMPADDAIEALDALRAKMIGQADPEVLNTVFCRSVTNFGIYEEMSLDAFVTGQRVQTIVYSEIDHLSSEREADGMYRTVLGTHLEVLTADGKTVWQDEQPEIVDRCRRQRRDFFVAQRVTLPATLPAGDYVLKVFVEDKMSGRATEVAHKFEMLSPTRLARPSDSPG